MNKAILLALMFLSGPASATVYRCVGSPRRSELHQQARFRTPSARRFAHSDPSRLSSYSPKAPRPPYRPSRPAASAPAASSQPSAKQVVFQAAAGDATPSAPRPGASRVLTGSVYRYEKDGVVHYTNVRPRGVPSAKKLFSYVEACYACGALPGVDFGKISLNTAAYSSEIHAAALQYGVEERSCAPSSTPSRRTGPTRSPAPARAA
jgi:hypothetical protein